MAEQKKLPPMEKEFDVQLVGEETGTTYHGTFRYRRPSIGERGRIEVNRARLIGDQTTVAADVADLMYVLAFLKVTLQAWPDWWQEAGFGSLLYDINVVLAVHEQCMAYEKEWKSKVHGDAEPVPGAA